MMFVISSLVLLLILVAASIVHFMWVAYVTLMAIAVLLFLPFIVSVLISALIGLGFEAGTGLPYWFLDLFWYENQGLNAQKNWLMDKPKPWFVGIVIGLVVGSCILWGYRSFIVVPADYQTVRQFSVIKDYIEENRKTENKGSHLEQFVIGNIVIKDGFGRPIIYREKMGGYMLVSYGYDGKKSEDDFCFSGGLRANRQSKQDKMLERFSNKNQGPSFMDKIRVYSQLKCIRSTLNLDEM